MCPEDRTLEQLNQDEDFTRPPGATPTVQTPGKLNEVTPPPAEVMDQLKKTLQDSEGPDRKPDSVKKNPIPQAEDPQSHWYTGDVAAEEKYWGDTEPAHDATAQALNQAIGPPTPDEQSNATIAQDNETYPGTDPAYQKDPGGMQDPVQNVVPERLTNGQAEEGIAPLTGWDSWAASLHRDFSDQATANIGYAVAEGLRKIESSGFHVPPISPEEANKRFPGMPEPFSQPIDPYIAQMQFSRFQRQQKMNDWAVRGGEGPLQGLGSGLISGLLDPVNVAAMLVAGPEVGSLSIQNVVLQNALMGGANTLIIGGQHKNDHLAPNFEDEVKGWIESSAEMSLLHVTLAHVFAQLKKRIAPDLLQEGTRTSVANNDEGAPPAPPANPVMMEADARARGASAEDNFKFNPVNHPSDRTWFQATLHDGESIEFSNIKGGTHFVDNENVANASALDFADGHGRVGANMMDEGGKYIDSEKPLPPELLAQAEAEFRKAGLEELTDLSEKPAGEILQSLDELPIHEAYDPMEVFKAHARAEGYEGITSVKTDENGNPLHNELTLFKDQVEPDAHYPADPDQFKAPMTEDEKAQALKDHQENPSNESSEIDQQIKAEKNKAPVDATPEQMDPVIQETEQNAMATLDKLAKENPQVAKEIEKLREEIAVDKVLNSQEQQAFKDFGDCVMGSST